MNLIKFKEQFNVLDVSRSNAIMPLCEPFRGIHFESKLMQLFPSKQYSGTHYYIFMSF